MEFSNKTKYYLKLVLITAMAYFSFKYLLPLFFPFLLGYLLAYFIKPMVKYANNKFRIKERTATIVLLVIVVGVIVTGLVVVVIKTSGQIKNLIMNYDKYEEKINIVMDRTCCMAEKYSGINKDKIENMLNKGIDGITEIGKSTDAKYTIMNKSLSMVVTAGEVFAIILTSVVSAYFMIMNGNYDKKKKIFLHRVQPVTKENEEQNSKEDNSVKNKSGNILLEDLKQISGKIGKVCIAYLKTELILMIITSAICFIGFKIMNNKYSLFLAVLVGFLDALPIIGVGILLIPFVIIYIILGNYFKAVITFITFLICYLVREFAEPKLMGSQIGISPLMSLISMYVGYKLFGIIGIVTGPIAYVLIDILMKQNE